MRLTLRTLLAYLDDRLPPTNAREIGQKITNSPFATDLVERIRDVKRRRRLAAPDKAQATIDPNLIAEYLDDQLTPELVARVEREILTSDVMLAEVAAAHEILGLLRDPVTVEPRLRDRLYGLDPTGKTDVIRAVGGEALPTRLANATAARWKPLTPRTVSSKRLPGIIAAVLAMIWLAIMASDSSLFGPPASKSDVVASDPVEDKMNSIQPAGVGDAGNVSDAAMAKDVAATVGANAATPDKSPVSNENSGDNSSAIVDSKAQIPATAVAAVPKTISTTVVKTTEAETTVVPRDAALPAQTPNQPPLAEDDSAVTPDYFLQGDSRGVLVLDESQQRWMPLSRIPGGEAIVLEPNPVNCEPIIDGQWFGVADRFPLQLTAESRGYTARLIGPCLVRTQKGASGGLDLLEGRLKLNVDRNTIWDNAMRPELALGTGSQRVDIVLQSQETSVAVESVLVAASNPTNPPATEDLSRTSVLPQDSDIRVTVTVLEGAIELKTPGEEEATALHKGQRASWTVLEQKDFSSLQIDNGVALTSVPAWLLENETDQITETTKQSQRVMDALSAGGEPGDTVLPLLEDRNPQFGVLAVKILSLIRDKDRLLSILFEPRDETVHRSAIDALSAIARSSLASKQAIANSLETRMPMAEADALLLLILGLSDDQAADPTVTADLIAMLNSDRLVTRTLAIYRMEQFTGDRKGFHPESDLSRRREAIRRWQRFLDQNSRKLVP